MHRVFIGIGGNIDPLSHIQRIKENINKSFEKPRFSDLYTTEPFQCGEQPPYINAAAEFFTEIDPEELLTMLLAWESEEGRIRMNPEIKEPRPLDLDLLLYGNKIMETERLTLPHPGITQRKFVLLPLLDLDAELTDPVSHRLYRSFFNNLSRQGVYRFSLKKYN